MKNRNLDEETYNYIEAAEEFCTDTKIITELMINWLLESMESDHILLLAETLKRKVETFELLHNKTPANQ